MLALIEIALSFIVQCTNDSEDSIIFYSIWFYTIILVVDEAKSYWKGCSGGGEIVKYVGLWSV